MTIAILVALLAGLLILGGVLLAWFVFRQRQLAGRQEPVSPSAKESGAPFGWSHVLLPVVVLVLSGALAAVFYPRLPVSLAYHFGADGSPDRWLRRSQFMVAVLVPQFLLAVLAIGLTWGVTRLSARLPPSARSGIRIEGVVRLMGNMIALPQVVLSFAMLNVFSYNAFHIRIVSFWVPAVIVMIIGVIILGVFFRRLMKERAKAG